MVEVDARDRCTEAGRVLERRDGEAGVDARHDWRVERDEEEKLARGGRSRRGEGGPERKEQAEKLEKSRERDGTKLEAQEGEREKGAAEPEAQVEESRPTLVGPDNPPARLVLVPPSAPRRPVLCRSSCTQRREMMTGQEDVEEEGRNRRDRDAASDEAGRLHRLRTHTEGTGSVRGRQGRVPNREGARTHLVQSGTELSGRGDHDDAGLLESGNLVLGFALAARDDGAGVTHCERGGSVSETARRARRGGREEDALRRPGGAVRPLHHKEGASQSQRAAHTNCREGERGTHAMKPTTGLFWTLYFSRYSAASSSIEPPISPMSTMPADASRMSQRGARSAEAV